MLVDKAGNHKDLKSTKIMKNRN